MNKIKIYNTLSRKKEVFKPIHKNQVGMYSCGPTVYSYPTIGNHRTYIFSDILKRVLEYNNYKVKQIINVTDVGHLTSDADEGEDKIEKAAMKEGKSAKEIADFYFKIFREDFEKLNILSPEKWPRATEHIKEQIELIKILEKKGYTYKTGKAVYFDISKFKNYTNLSRQKLEDKNVGVRENVFVDKEKRNPQDFVLWFFTVGHFKDHALRWNSPFGIGFPGWHIECSAMSMKYLGKHFDIHTGGQDHIQIHHTNEIAQSEGATGKKFVNYWMHGAFLTYHGEKVSKSKGGLYTIFDLEERGFQPLSFRYLCLTTHYRKPLDFSLEKLKSSENSLERLKNKVCSCMDDGKINRKYLLDFENAINNDLNIPKALQVLWNLLRDEKAEGKFQTAKKMDSVLGLDLTEKEKISIPEKITKLAKERQKMREEKNWKKSDELRKKINNFGYTIEDNEKGFLIKKK
ncbi:cysteine--tRNA ligase [Candidatus Pacearchaeota archaeon]|nr:cysteine--tRNA ligase [Candidatus Pacearchaeota archaeon]